LLCDPDWLNAALDAIRANKGFNTPGTDGVKGDELDQAQIDRLAEHLRQGTYHPTPVRRVFIPKRSGKLRPLGLPSAADKVVQSALKLLLEPIYETAFRDCAHGFRPARSCHTALKAHLSPPHPDLDGGGRAGPVSLIGSITASCLLCYGSGLPMSD
jgi:RNA-directed DNA polymerase